MRWKLVLANNGVKIHGVSLNSRKENKWYKELQKSELDQAGAKIKIVSTGSDKDKKLYQVR